jgi:hypothetical protein
MEYSTCLALARSCTEGGVHHSDRQQPARVDQQMPLATPHFLPGVEANLLAAARGLGRLGVQHRRARLRVAALGPADLVA